ncbi:FecR domain-containing protein [Halobacteriovorax sp. HLS]|uniref:FecR family protein n=1 Tax=Halobacteriovorax sp. HLS TaxID=2234000 RepID=UPI000FDAAC99|nr:FecR family protein [Halobacteriovorax sp. HLS]
MKLFLFLFFISFSTFANLATVSRVKGDAVVNIKTRVTQGMKLNEFDILETVGEKSFVEIKFKSGHLVRLRSGKVVIKKMTSNETVFKLIKGKIFNYVQKLNKNQKFKVETIHSSLGVRGTMFMVSVEEDKSYLCVCEGSVETNNGKTKNLVNRGEDQFIDSMQAFEVKKASSDMMTMATDEFKSMGLEVN